MAQQDWYGHINLKPRHLQLLAALDDLRHVGKVAANINITQPAVSKALAELERGLGRVDNQLNQTLEQTRLSMEKSFRASFS